MRRRREDRPELGQGEGLLEVWPPDGLEECQRIAPDRVTGAEDHVAGDTGVGGSQTLEELASTHAMRRRSFGIEYRS